MWVIAVSGLRHGWVFGGFDRMCELWKSKNFWEGVQVGTLWESVITLPETKIFAPENG